MWKGLGSKSDQHIQWRPMASPASPDEALVPLHEAMGMPKASWKSVRNMTTNLFFWVCGVWPDYGRIVGSYARGHRNTFKHRQAYWRCQHPSTEIGDDPSATKPLQYTADNLQRQFFQCLWKDMLIQCDVYRSIPCGPFPFATRCGNQGPGKIKWNEDFVVSWPILVCTQGYIPKLIDLPKC